jgi:hypothetical protein
MANYPIVGVGLEGDPEVAGKYDPNAVPKFEAPRIDKEIAAEFKARFSEALAPVLAIAREAVAAEFNVGINFGRDAYGRLTLEAGLTKHF